MSLVAYIETFSTNICDHLAKQGACRQLWVAGHILYPSTSHLQCLLKIYFGLASVLNLIKKATDGETTHCPSFLASYATPPRVHTI